MNAKRIIVGLSGGVDSAVAAWLLLQQGYQVDALFMKNWEDDDRHDYCAAAEDRAVAQAVADHLGIQLYTVNFATEYWDRVFCYFLQEYQAGRTPNPDVLCNSEIKFRAFLDHAMMLGADAIATGHYARLAQQPDGYHLLAGCDQNKDQSYFLYQLNQQQLAHALFPLGELQKNKVRQLAQEAQLPNHARKDSTGICFIGERRFRTFLSRYLPAEPGTIETMEGQVVGQHQGLMYYTIGQRQGLGIGGQTQGNGQPWFVAAKDFARNVLLVVQGHQHPSLYHPALETQQLHWITRSPVAFPFSCQARIRYRQPLQDCTIHLQSTVQGARVTFATPQWAIAPGQSIVFYQQEQCLGGAVITNPLTEEQIE